MQTSTHYPEPAEQDAPKQFKSYSMCRSGRRWQSWLFGPQKHAKFRRHFTLFCSAHDTIEYPLRFLGSDKRQNAIITQSWMRCNKNLARQLFDRYLHLISLSTSHISPYLHIRLPTQHSHFLIHDARFSNSLFTSGCPYVHCPRMSTYSPSRTAYHNAQT